MRTHADTKTITLANGEDVTFYWAPSLGRYVTIPGADAHDEPEFETLVDEPKLPL